MRYKLLLLLFFLAPHAFANRIWSTGYELQSVAANVEFDSLTGTGSISKTTVRSGLAALRINPTAGVAYMSHVVRADSVTGLYVRAAVYPVTYPTATSSIIEIISTADATIQCRARLAANGQVELWTASTNIANATPPTIRRNTWNIVEVRWETGVLQANTGICEMKVNGIVTDTASTVANHQSGTIHIGLNNSANVTGDVYFDDVAVNDNFVATGETSYPGDGHIVHFHPNAVANFNTQCTKGGSTPAATTYQSLQETIPDDAVTTCNWLNANDFNNFYFDKFASTTLNTIATSSIIKVVQGGIRVSAVTTNPASYNTVLLSKTNSALNATSSLQTTGSISYFTHTVASPFVYGVTAYAPSMTDFNSLQLGIISPDATPDVIVSNLWLLVDFMPRRRTTLTQY